MYDDDLLLGRRIIRGDASLAAVVEAVRAVGEESVTTSSGESVTTDWSVYGARVLPLQVVIEVCAVELSVQYQADPDVDVRYVYRERERRATVLHVLTIPKGDAWLMKEPKGKDKNELFWPQLAKCGTQRVVLVRATTVNVPFNGHKDFLMQRGNEAGVSSPSSRTVRASGEPKRFGAHEESVRKEGTFNVLDVVKRLDRPRLGLFDGVNDVRRVDAAGELAIKKLISGAATPLSDAMSSIASENPNLESHYSSNGMFKFFEEVTFACVRPDYTVFTVNGIAQRMMGLIEVKGLCHCVDGGAFKTDVTCNLLNGTVLGVVYDQLSVFAGKTDVENGLCILTCVNHTFIAAILDEHDEEGQTRLRELFEAETIDECMRIQGAWKKDGKNLAREASRLITPKKARNASVALTDVTTASGSVGVRLSTLVDVGTNEGADDEEKDSMSEVTAEMGRLEVPSRATDTSVTNTDVSPPSSPVTPPSTPTPESSPKEKYSPPTPSIGATVSRLLKADAKEGDTGAENEEVEKVSAAKRELLVSQPFRSNGVGDESLGRVLLSALIKMFYCPRKEVVVEHNKPFTGRALLVREGEPAVWTRFATLRNGPLNFGEVPGGGTKLFFCLRFLGNGADGRVALACNRAGRVAALKFYFPRAPREVEQKEGEAKEAVAEKPLTEANKALVIWQKVYHDVPALTSRVRTVKLREPFAFEGADTEALLMPFLKPVDVERREGLLDKVKACLEKFVDANCEHGDVAWRNIGTYIDSKGEEQVVVFDMSSVIDVKPHSSDGSARWVEEAMSELRSRAVPQVLNA
jgi:hypothetical protein